ncbi:site-specific integrase [Microbispora sp. NPDC004025]
MVALTTLPSASKSSKKRKHDTWSVDEARRFLEHLRTVEEPLYAAFVLTLVLGLRRGEVLGLTWDCVDLAGQELWVSHQLSRVRGELLHRDTRHTCASFLAALDVHPRVAMRILRHSQISVTMNVYTQVPSPETRKALDRLNRNLDT